jgi:uncharacterized protein YegP (UPF0339 family)
MAAKFEIRSPKAGQFRWVLISQGRTLATGETYARRALAERAIDSFRMVATAAPVVDTTVPATRPAVAKAARTGGRVVGKAAGTTRRTVKAAANKAVKAPTAAKRTADKAAKAVEKTAAKAAKKTAAPRKRSAGSR